MSTTYTHIGYKVRVGYQHHGRDWNHRETIVPGRTHALNREYRYTNGHRCPGYRAVCGVWVPEESSDDFDQSGSNPITLAIGGDGWRITCKACQRRTPVAAERPTKRVWLVKYIQDGETVTYQAHDRREHAEAQVAYKLEHGDTFGRPVEKAWVEEGVRVVG